MQRERASQPRSSSSTQPRHISESLGEAARLAGVPGGPELVAIQRHWEAAVGPYIASHARPRKLVKGVLVVSADHPALACELRLLSEELLGRLRESVGSCVESVTVAVDRRAGAGW